MQLPVVMLARRLERPVPQGPRPPILMPLGADLVIAAAIGLQAALVGLLEAIDAGEVSKDAARKEVFPRMVDSGKSARDLV